MHLRYRDELPDIVAKELDSLIAQLHAKLFLEHNEDGSHRGSSLVSASDPANADKSDSDTGLVPDASRHWKAPGPWLFDERGAANEHMVGLRPPKLTTGTYNDYAPQGINDAVILEIEPDGGTVTLTGLRQHQGIARNKRMLLIRNRDSAENLILVHSSTSSSTGSRFFLPGNANVTMGPGQNIWLYYDPAKDGWTAAITPHVSGGLGTGASSTNALLDGASHTDTVAQGVTRGSLIYGNSTPKWDELAIGAANRVLRSDGTDVSWGQVNLATDVTGSLPVGDGVWTLITKASDETIQTDTTLTNDAALVFSMTSGVRYHIRATILRTSDSSADFKFAFVAPAHSRYFVRLQEGETEALSGAVGTMAESDPGTLAPATTTNALGMIKAELFIEPTSSGTFAFQWAQNISQALDTTVYRGSTLEYKTY